MSHDHAHAPDDEVGLRVQALERLLTGKSGSDPNLS
jgi:hypothetical protein